MTDSLPSHDGVPDRASSPTTASVVLEAVIVPALLLTAALLGSLRLGDGGALRFVGPTVFSLVLATGLALVLLRARVLVPERLVAPGRTAIANANGAVVLAATVFAAAQIFTLLMPESGLMAILFGVFYVALLATIGAARPDAPRLVQSLLVVFGTALVLRFVVLNGLAAPAGGGLARRLFAAALEGLTLGALGLEHHAPATGYAAFLALVAFFAGLLLVPGGSSPWALLGAEGERGR
jgi:hypothetical protein